MANFYVIHKSPSHDSEVIDAVYGIKAVAGRMLECIFEQVDVSVYFIETENAYVSDASPSVASELIELMIDEDCNLAEMDAYDFPWFLLKHLRMKPDDLIEHYNERIVAREKEAQLA